MQNSETFTLSNALKLWKYFNHCHMWALKKLKGMFGIDRQLDVPSFSHSLLKV